MRNGQQESDTIALSMLYIAARSWNPDNFDELIELMKLQHPSAVARWLRETSYDLLERIAAQEHDQWIDWSKSVSGEVSPDRLERWKKLWIGYTELSEEEKRKDREYAKKVIALL